MGTDLTKPQHIRNRLACLMTKSPPFTCNVPLLRSLHWLPEKFRILFKISLLTYKTFHEKQPAYLQCMLAASLPSRSLRSNKGISLSVPRVKGSTGARAFHSCAPSLWNNLPLSFRPAISDATFKKYLKTSLWLGLSPIDTGTPDGPLMLWNCFFDFAVEHWFGCHVPEPGFAGDIVAIEIWLIDWLIDWLTGGARSSCLGWSWGCGSRVLEVPNKKKPYQSPCTLLLAYSFTYQL